MIFDLVENQSVSDEAARVVGESWPAPHLRATPATLRWQSGFPASIPSLGVMAFDGREPVGYAAALPRRARFRGECREVYILSFVAVRPEWRGRGVASGLYRRLLDGVGEAGAPVVIFAQEGSAGQAVLEKSLGASGLATRPFGVYKAYGYVPRAVEAAPHAVRDVEGAEEFSAVTSLSEAETTLATCPGPRHWEHYRDDPRPRAFLVARAGGVGPAGGATAVRTEVVTPQGPEAVTVVENLFLPAAVPGVLRSLLHAAALRWPGGSAKSVVTVPNVRGIDPGVLREAGLRQTFSHYGGYLASANPSDPVLEAEGTNLEVI